MKQHRIIFVCIFSIFALTLTAQSIDDAKKWYLEGNYSQAKPVFEAEYQTNPNNAALNQWLGVIAFTQGDYAKAKKHLEFASQKNIPESYLYLGELYAKSYRFADAEKEFAKYERANRKKKPALAKLESKREDAAKLKRLVHRTENVQIIDSVVVPKSDFLSAYKLGASAGLLQNADRFFKNNGENSQTIYVNERGDKVYFSRGDSVLGNKLYSLEKLLNSFGNEKRLSEAVNQSGNQDFPFVMPDGLTLYFASTGHNSLGGYDLFVTRQNLATDSYLTPNQLNMPFNSPFNDYMMAIDEEKGIGWFASDRFQPVDSVCVYTFIPSPSVVLLESEDENYLANRARISSIKDSWAPDADYSALLQRAQTSAPQQTEKKTDFTFVINDQATYHTLADFKQADARNLFSQALELEKRLAEMEKELSAKRDQFVGNPNNSTLRSNILQLEKESELIFGRIESLKFRARNEEIRNRY